MRPQPVSNSDGFSSAVAPIADDLSTFTADLAALREQVAAVIDARARQAKETADAGLAVTRAAISTYPVSSMALVAAAGVGIGLLLTSRRPAATGDHYARARDQLGLYASQLRATLADTANRVSMSERLERVGSALSSVDAKPVYGPIIDRIMDWLAQGRDAAKATIDKATSA